MHLITNNTVTIPPYHISIPLLKAINNTTNNNIKHNGLIQIEENPFLAIEQPDLVLISTLQKLGPQTPRWSDCTIKKKHDHQLCKRIRLHGLKPPDQKETAGKMTENNPHNIFGTVGEVTEISYEKIPQMPEELAFMFCHNFYPKPKIDLKDAKICKETRQTLLTLQ